MIGLRRPSEDVRMLDDFKMGPNLVRGFAPAGIGPRDITPGTSNDALGGTKYWGASLEFQYPFYFLPKDSGFRGAVFVDAGSVWGYKGETHVAGDRRNQRHIRLTHRCTGGRLSPGQCGMQYADSRDRTHVGRRQHHLGFAVRSVAFRFRLSDPEAGLRSDPILRLRRRHAFLIAAEALVTDGRMPDYLHSQIAS